MNSLKTRIRQIAVCLALVSAGIAFFVEGVNSTSEPIRDGKAREGNFASNFGNLMGGMFGNMGGLGGLGGFGGMGSLGGFGGLGGDDEDDDDIYGFQGADYDDVNHDSTERQRPHLEEEAFSIEGIIGLMNGATQLLQSMPDLTTLIPMVLRQGAKIIDRFCSKLPGIIRSARPEVQQILEDSKEPVRKLAAMAMKTKKRLMGRGSWAKGKSVELDLLERALTFCPGVNMTAIAKSGTPWDSFEFQLIDRCVEAGCDGRFDLCCPYVAMGTYGIIKANCVYSLKKHFGNCPAGYKTAFFDQADIREIMSTDHAFPTCRIDTDCKITERCCMKEERSEDPSSPYAICMESDNKNRELGEEWRPRGKE